MPFTLIDSHAHLHFPAFDADLQEVIARTRAANIGLVTVGTKLSTSQSGIRFAELHEHVWCTIGLHPSHVHNHHFVDKNEEGGETPTPEHAFDEERYAALVTHPKVVAIGEFGLDYSRIPEGMDVERFKEDQRTVARAQLRFATKHNKPVVIHCRGGATADVTGAHDDMRALIAEENAKRMSDESSVILNEVKDLPMKSSGNIRGVIHCFTGTAEDARRYAELGFLISITGIVTFGKSVAAAVKEIPLQQMMIETDCPYLAPAPHRGKRNEPANVVLVAQAIADVKGISLAEVARVTTANAEKLFGIG